MNFYKSAFNYCSIQCHILLKKRLISIHRIVNAGPSNFKFYKARTLQDTFNTRVMCYMCYKKSKSIFITHILLKRFRVPVIAYKKLLNKLMKGML